MGTRNNWIWEAMIGHLIMTAKVWPWVCAASFATLASAEQWTPRILTLLGWPFASMLLSLFGIMIVTLISRFHDKPMPLILWGFFLACDVGCIMAAIYNALDPRNSLFFPR